MVCIGVKSYWKLIKYEYSEIFLMYNCIVEDKCNVVHIKLSIYLKIQTVANLCLFV